MTDLRICIDVPDLDAGIAFYTRALGLTPGRRNGAHWAKLLGAGCPVDLLPCEAGTPPSPGCQLPSERQPLEVVGLGLEEVVDQENPHATPCARPPAARSPCSSG